MNGTKAEPLAYSVPEAAKALGISKTLAYEAVLRGEIPSIKIGARRIVPRAAIDQLLRAGESVAAPTLRIA